jgi:hypothetical protein
MSDGTRCRSIPELQVQLRGFRNNAAAAGVAALPKPQTHTAAAAHKATSLTGIQATSPDTPKRNNIKATTQKAAAVATPAAGAAQQQSGSTTTSKAEEEPAAAPLAAVHSAAGAAAVKVEQQGVQSPASSQASKGAAGRAVTCVITGQQGSSRRGCC